MFETSPFVIRQRLTNHGARCVNLGSYLSLAASGSITLFPVTEPPGSGGIDCRAVPQELDIKIAREGVKRAGGSISRLRPKAVGVAVRRAVSSSLAYMSEMHWL
jgi:hypothetical protein